MVCYFIGVYIMNRTLQGRLEIRNFSSRVEKHSKRNFVSPPGHVISSIKSIQYINNVLERKLQRSGRGIYAHTNEINLLEHYYRSQLIK